MNAAAKNIIQAAFTAAAALDPTLTQERTTSALVILDGKTTAEAHDATLFPPIMTPEEVAAVTKLSTRSLRSYAQRGEIRRAYYSQDKKRSAGYTGASVRAFVERATAVAAVAEKTPEPVEVEIA